MSVGTSRTAAYLECFYVMKMTLTEIARQFGVSETAVRKAVTNFDPEAYREEKKRRSQKKVQKSPTGRKTKPKRKPEHIQEEREAWEWLQRRFDRIFPFLKKKGVPDAELVWFSCANSGIDEVLNSPCTTRDLKSAIRSARRTVFAPQHYIETHLEDLPSGAGKIGRQGSRYDRNVRVALLG